MKANRSSLTAEGIAMVRALESRRPPDERVSVDPYAECFLGPTTRAIDLGMRGVIRLLGWPHFDRWMERKGEGVFGFLVARARYFDDRLVVSLEDGLEQLVILGAGFDSRAYRFQGLEERSVRVFEVDHPATQAVKLRRLTRKLGRVPGHVTFVGIDFTRQRLEECLLDHGYSPSAKTLFLWEGVTEYLTREAVDQTLRFVARRSGRGSEIVFDYLAKAALDGRLQRKEVARMRRMRRISGEPLTLGFDPEELPGVFTQAGLELAENVGRAQLEARYFAGSGRRVSDAYGIARGVIL